MRHHALTRPILAAGAVLAAAALTGCGPQDPATTTSDVPTAAASASAAPQDGEAAGEETDGEEASAAAVPECDGFLLSVGEEVDGRTVGECVAAAMLLAGSGVQRVDSDDGTSSTVSFRWDPDYAMSVDGDQQVVVEGDTGWVRMPGTGWVQADPGSSDPQAVMATTVVDLVRVFSDPRVLAEGFAAAPSWTVVEEGPVPVDDAVADVAWRLEPEGGVLPLGEVSVTDYELWLRPDHLGVFARGTGTYAGVSVTTSNTFLQWGGDVDIPDPGAAS